MLSGEASIGLLMCRPCLSQYYRVSEMGNWKSELNTFKLIFTKKKSRVLILQISAAQTYIMNMNILYC